MKLDDIQEILSLILIDILVDERNGFEKREYFIVSRLLKAIKNYPLIGIPDTRVGLLIDHESYLEEYVIRFQDDILWVGMEGFERTPMGADSYENEDLNLSHTTVETLYKSNPDFEYNDINSWYVKALDFLASDECKITLECYNPQ
ncbi:MAG TPA: hypothetical protein VFG54_00290 [Prolixibacteraceae bacterium]|nr:hypothetical protein [Prolixibacteraceae bacterium]